MNLGDVLPFVTDQLVSLGLREHVDTFNRDNIPSMHLDQSFALDLGSINGGPANQLLHVFSFPLTIRVYFKDYRNGNVMRMQALAKGQQILEKLLNPTTRLNHGFKDIRPNQITLEPISNSNDLSAVLKIGLDVLLHFKF